MRHWPLWLTGLMFVAGCAAPLPEPLSCPEMQVAAPMNVEISQGRVMTPEEAQIFGMGAVFSGMREAPHADTRPRRLKVALLSAGGQRGAFAAGFMTGWSDNPVDTRPDAFDVVTGVSTGALMAPFVFAGKAYDPYLEELYDGVRERDVLRRRSTLELAGAPSLWDSAPLVAQVNRYLTPELVEDIAAAAEKRALLVGAVNISTGFFEAFDLAQMAASSNPERTGCLAEGLLASAAVPVAFPPRHIGGDLYIDGAARQGLFLQGLAASGMEPEIYVFLNQSEAFPTDDPDFALPQLAGRSTQILSDALLRASAADAVRFARDQGWRVRGVFAPDIFPGPACEQRTGGKLFFCESFTRDLFAAGRDLGRTGPIPWLDADQLLERIAATSPTRRN